MKILNEPVCPYCSSVLTVIPQRKKKCTVCGNPVYPRYHYLTKERLFLTQEQVNKYEQEVSAYYARLEIIQVIRGLGYSEEDFQKAKDYLKKKDGFEPSDRDIYWQFSHERLSLLMKQADFPGMSSVYYQQALFADRENRDFKRLLRESIRCELLGLKQSRVVNKVEILDAPDSCEPCKKQHGRILTIDEALREMPIPHPSCTSPMIGGRPGFCRCRYIPYKESWYS